MRASDNTKWQKNIQKLQLQSSRNVEICSSFHGTSIYIRNCSQPVYNAYRGPFCVIVSTDKDNQNCCLLVTDLTYQNSNGIAGEVKLFNHREMSIPETELPLADCDVYLRIYCTETVLKYEFRTVPVRYNVPADSNEEWFLLARVTYLENGAIYQLWNSGDININYRWW